MSFGRPFRPKDSLSYPLAPGRVRVHPYNPHNGTVWVSTPRAEVQRSPRQLPEAEFRKFSGASWYVWKLSDLEIAGIVFALIGLTIHIFSMITNYWAMYTKHDGSVKTTGIFPQCQYVHGCLPVGPVGCATIMTLVYGLSIPVLFLIYTTCYWRHKYGRYLEYATTANCFVACIGVFSALLLAGLRLWNFPLPGYTLDYSYYLEIGAGFGFIVAGVLFLIHVRIQW